MEFQENSYGIRPQRSCGQAVLKLLEYVNDGCDWIVDIDLEKFFDNVPQDKLMGYVGRVIRDPDTESLIRKYLKSGVMENGIYSATEVGTPQGGNLSPLFEITFFTASRTLLLVSICSSSHDFAIASSLPSVTT